MAPRHFAECLLSEETRSADVVTDTSARKPNILQNRTETQSQQQDLLINVRLL